MSLSRLGAALFILPFLSLSASAQKLKIIYTSGGQFSLSPNLIGTLEALLLEDPEHVRLEKVDMRPAYASNGHYTLELSSDAKKDLLPKDGMQRAVAQEIDILENAKAIAFVQPKTYYPLLDKLLALSTSPASSMPPPAPGKNPSRGRVAPSPASEGFTPGVVKAKAYLGEIKGGADEDIPLLIRDKNRIPGVWSAAAIWHYHLSVDGRPVVVTIIGKPLGGPARTRTALLEKLSKDKDPKLMLVTGDLYQPPNLVPDLEMIARSFEQLGFNASAMHAGDLEIGWNSISAQKNTRLPKIISNLRAEEGAPLFYERWMVKEINGVRIGIFSLVSKEVEIYLRRKGLPYHVEDAIQSAKEVLGELRAKERVDLTVCISNQKREDDARMLVEVPDIDILIGGYSREIASKRKNRAEFSGWKRETHFWPAVQTFAPSFGYGEINLEFEPSPAGPELISAQTQLFTFGEETQEDAELSIMAEKIIDVYIKPQEAILPDPRHLWPFEYVRISYGAVDFWNLAAQALRDQEKTEVAFFRITPLGSRVPGSPSEGFLWEWMMPDQRVAIVKVPGRVLRSLLARVDFEPAPPSNNRSDESKYVAQPWLAAAGIDKQARVSGLPIKDAEIYSVAVSEELLKIKEFSDLNSGSVKMHEHTYAPSVFGWLKKRRENRDREADNLYHQALRRALKGESRKAKDPEFKARIGEAFAKEKREAGAIAQKHYESEIRDLAEGKTPTKPVWRLNLQTVSLQFANTRVENNAAYPGVPNARIQAIDQVFVRGSNKLYSELYWDRVTWNTGFTADYGRLTLKPRDTPQIKNETIDQFIGETDLTFRAWTLNRRILQANAGPFVNFSYDTEFTKPLAPLNLPRRQIVRFKPGFKLYQGRYIQELSLAALYQRNYAKRPRDSDRGWEAALSWISPLPPTGVMLLLQSSYRRLMSDPTDTAIDLKSETNAKASLKVPVWGNLNLSPFVDFYRFEGQLSQPAGRNVIFGFALDFSQMWKW